MKNIVKNTAVLLIISVVAFVALAFVYELTKEPIALAEQKAKVEAYQAVYAEAKSFEAVDGSAATLTAFNADCSDAQVAEVLAAVSADGKKMGYVFTVTAVGYGGEVKFAYGVDVTGTVVGYDVISHSETPGYGAKCTDGFVREQYPGVTSADQVDGITGATYTTDALKNSVQAAIDLTKQLEGGAA